MLSVFLSLAFISLTTMCLGMVFLYLSWLGSSEHLESVGLCISPVWETSKPLPLWAFIMPYCLAPSGMPITCILDLLMLSHMSLLLLSISFMFLVSSPCFSFDNFCWPVFFKCIDSFFCEVYLRTELGQDWVAALARFNLPLSLFLKHLECSICCLNYRFPLAGFSSRHSEAVEIFLFPSLVHTLTRSYDCCCCVIHKTSHGGEQWVERISFPTDSNQSCHSLGAMQSSSVFSICQQSF